MQNSKYFLIILPKNFDLHSIVISSGYFLSGMQSKTENFMQKIVLFKSIRNSKRRNKENFTSKAN